MCNTFNLSWFKVVEGGGEMDITLQVISPHGAVLVNDEKKRDEMHTVTTADTGIYSFCFDNSFSTLAEKIVYVDLGLEAYDEESWLQTLGDGDIEGTEIKIESLRVCFFESQLSCLFVFCFVFCFFL